MPTLILKLVPGDKGITKCRLCNPLKAQNLKLQSVVINKQANGYAGSQLYIRLPFASASQIHSSDHRGFLSVPTAISTSGMEIHNFSEGLPIESDNIPEIFECLLLKHDMTPFTANTNLHSVHLYFSYETHSLF